VAGFTFETLVDELRSQFDCSQGRAVEIVNHRLDEMLARSEAMEYYKTLGNTTSGTHTYTLTATVLKLKQIVVAYSTGTALYEGTSYRTLLDIDVGNLYAGTDEYLYAIVHNTDDDATTASFRLYPTPAESSVAMMGRYVGLPADLTYSSGTALPIPLDAHEALLAGCRAELYRRDEDRQDLAASEEARFAEGIAALKEFVNARSEGDAPIRAQLWGFDFL